MYLRQNTPDFNVNYHIICIVDTQQYNIGNNTIFPKIKNVKMRSKISESSMIYLENNNR